MKKLMLAFVLSCAMVLGIVVAVSADNGPHGSFTASTDACASCHRAHSAQVGSNSLLKSDPEALCLSCHDGTGAHTDVVDGVYKVAANPTTGLLLGVEGTDLGSLFGGGFTNAMMATTWSGKVAFDATFNATSTKTTSHHALGGTGAVYGSGAVNSANATMTLECTSCHDPHGTAGYQMTYTNTAAPLAANAGTWTVSTTKVASYRLLRFQPQGSSGFTAPTGTSNWSGGAFPVNTAGSGWTVPDRILTNGAEWYTTTTDTTGVTGNFALGDYNQGNGGTTSVYNVDTRHNYTTSAANVAYFCAQCHDRYFTNTRLRNATDVSAYCGSPLAGVVAGKITLTQYLPTAAGQHPVDSVRCQPVLTAGVVTAWGDNGDTGDGTYKFMHNSGDVLRASTDGTNVPTLLPATAADVTAAAALGYTIQVGDQTVTQLGRSCLTCHVSHGTSAAVTGLAGTANQVFAKTTVVSSTLLRMDNRSVCLRCHASTVNFTVGP